MSKFIVLYRAPQSAMEQMASGSPEQREAGAAAWRAWATKVSYALTDLGAPLAHTTHVGPGGASEDGVCGYSILESGSADEIETILKGHPHLTVPGASIEVLEAIPFEM
jgi:hypothetical protein